MPRLAGMGDEEKATAASSRRQQVQADTIVKIRRWKRAGKISNRHHADERPLFGDAQVECAVLVHEIGRFGQRPPLFDPGTGLLMMSSTGTK